MVLMSERLLRRQELIANSVLSETRPSRDRLKFSRFLFRSSDCRHKRRRDEATKYGPQSGRLGHIELVANPASFEWGSSNVAARRCLVTRVCPFCIFEPLKSQRWPAVHPPAPLPSFGSFVGRRSELSCCAGRDDRSDRGHNRQAVPNSGANTLG